MTVRQLGYIGLSTCDIAGWRRLLVDVLGCQPAIGFSAELLPVRVDDRSRRITVRAGERDQIDYLGFEVADAASLAALVDRLRSAGHKVEEGDPTELDDRQVLGLASTTDPAGYRLELFHGPTVDERPFVSSLGIPSFVTGSLGLGHLVMATPHYEDTLRFYRDQLGFRVSDHIVTGDLEATFLRCNPRHHTLALLRLPVDAGDSQFHHFMLETPDLDCVGRAHDRCLDSDFPLSFSLGRHTNDHMVSFYVRTPSGFEIEFGTGGRLVDDEAWDVDQYRATSYWGHRRLLPG